MGMLPPGLPHTPTESRIGRRDFLKVCATGALALGTGEALQAQAARTRRPLIMLFLSGGPSHKETWNPDLPDVVPELRGPFSSLQTAAGFRISELFPEMARRSRDFSILRGIRTNSVDHPESALALLKPRGDTLGVRWGAQAADGGMPYTFVNHLRTRTFNPAHQIADSFEVTYDTDEERFAPPDLDFDQDIEERRGLLEAFDTPVPSPLAGRHDRFRELAFSLLQGDGEFMNAFELPDDERQQYGNSVTGDGLLLARRLAAAGAGAITVHHEPLDLTWDWHNGIIGMRRITPEVDRAVSALLDDIREEKSNAVLLVVGEFSRTPRINGGAGRDHWPEANCAVLAGGYTRGGVAHGRVSPLGLTIDGNVTPQAFLNTVQLACGGQVSPAEPKVREVLQ